MLELILTCDLGTTSCKTTLFTTEGKVKAQMNREYKTYYPKADWAEQDADEWWDTVVNTVKACTNCLDEDFKILSIALSSQRETFVPVDRSGKPLYRAVLWLDKRNTAQTEEIENRFGRKYIHDITGMVPYPNFTATKLLWFKQNDPELLRNTYKILQPRDYIYYKLTGKFITDYSLASRTMMLNLRSRAWEKEIMDYVGVNESIMPDIYCSHEAPGTVTDEVSAMLNINKGIPVVVGGGDRCCEALGSGIQGRSAMESTATAGNVSLVANSLPENLNDKVLCTSHVLEGKYLLEQGLTTTGSILRWFRDNIYYSGSNSTDSLS
jgi:xylulokinase